MLSRTHLGEQRATEPEGGSSLLHSITDQGQVIPAYFSLWMLGKIDDRTHNQTYDPSFFDGTKD